MNPHSAVILVSSAAPSVAGRNGVSVVAYFVVVVATGGQLFLHQVVVAPPVQPLLTHFLLVLMENVCETPVA